MKTAVLAVLLACCGWAQTYRITGVMVDSVSDHPLAKVRVMVTDEAGNSKPREMTTSADGRFTFDGIPAGSWTLSAERKGYLPQSFGQNAVGEAWISVITGPEGVSENLKFRLDAPASVGGKVADDHGEPVEGAHVELVMRVRGEFLVRKVVATDDQGEYRIPDIPPVTCYLLVIVPVVRDEDEDGFAPQYYRGTTDPKTATAITLKPGEEFAADFALTRAKGVTLAVDGDSGIRNGNDAEILILLGQGPGGSEVSVATLGPGQGRSFENILPGRYKLVIGDVGSTFSTSRWVDVGAEDVEVKLPFENPPDVTVRVRVVDGGAGLLKHAALRLHMASDAGNNTRPLEQDGTARFAAMAAGVYQVTLESSQELYIKSVTARNAKVKDGKVELPESGAVQLEIVTGGDGGEVKGKVRAESRPVQGAEVVLAPQMESKNPMEYYGYVSDSDGSFDLKGVKPGEYVLFATRDRELDYTDLKAIRPYLAAGKVVKVEARGSLEVQVELQQP
jgi:hypothetical protein